MSAERPFPLASVRADPAVTAAALLPAGGDVATWDPTGDTAFELLLRGAERVRVVLPAPARAPLLALKVAAIRSLPAAGARDLLGAGPIGRRVWFYHSIRSSLPANDRAWWDAHERVVREGALREGAWERHIETFRARLLPRVHGEDAVRALLGLTEGDDCAGFVRTRWRTPGWRAAVAGWFAGGLHQLRPGLGRRGLDVERRVNAALTGTVPGDSPPLVWWLAGMWTGGRGTPRWLTEAGLTDLRPRLDALSIVAESDLDRVDAADLDEAWDVASPARRPALLSLAAATVRPGGRLLVRSEDGGIAVPGGLHPIPSPSRDPSPFASPATLLAKG